MPSVYQHSRGKTPYWIAVFTDENGTQRHRSTKTTKRAEALVIAERFQRAADKHKRQKLRNGEVGLKNRDLVLESLIVASQKAVEGSFTEHEAKKTLNTLLEACGQSVMNSVSTKTFFADWIDSKTVSKAVGTAKRYRHTIDTFISHLGSKAGDSISAVTARDIETFRDLQLKEGKSPMTANLAVKTLRIPFNLARRQGMILTNPAEAIELLSAQSATRETFTLDQIAQLLTKADIEWKGMILLGACAGLRIGDASKLTWKNIDLERQAIRLFPAKTSRGSKKPLEIVLLPDLEKYLLDLPVKGDAPESPLFPKLYRKPVSGVAGLSLSFRKLMSVAGIESDVITERKKGTKGRRFFALGFHSLRHTFISFMANTGVSEELRMKLAGHTSDVHQRYTHHDLATFRKALSKFPTFTK
jgi:integrase